VSGDKDATRAAVNDDARNSSRRSPPDMLGLTPHGEALPEREQHRKQRPRRERAWPRRARRSKLHAVGTNSPALPPAFGAAPRYAAVGGVPEGDI
jgi:anti-sigma factor RsiW